MSDSTRQRRGSLFVALGITLLGLGMVGGVAYVGATSTVTRADFAEYQNGCEELANQTRMVDAGMGMRWESLNETDVRRCRSATYAQYRAGKLRSMYTPPLNLKQWMLYLGIGGSMAAVGGVLLRQELAAGE